MKKNSKNSKKILFLLQFLLIMAFCSKLFSINPNHSYKCYVKIWHYSNKKNVGIKKKFLFLVSDRKIALSRAYYKASLYVNKNNLKYVQILVYRIEKNNDAI